MAIRGTLRHPKTMALARQLDLEPWEALGILEALWHFTAEYAISGDLSAFDAYEIAVGLTVTSIEPEVLLNALIARRWIDLTPNNRMYVHDWPDWADEYTRRKLLRQGITTFPDGRPVRKPKPADDSQPTVNRRSTDSKPPVNRQLTGGPPYQNQNQNQKPEPGRRRLSVPEKRVRVPGSAPTPTQIQARANLGMNSLDDILGKLAQQPSKLAPPASREPTEAENARRALIDEQIAKLQKGAESP